MTKGTTKSGFSYEISDDVVNDWELLEMLSDMDDNIMVVVPFAKKILGTDQYNKLKLFCKNENGTVQTDKMSETIIEIFTSQKELKN